MFKWVQVVNAKVKSKIWKSKALNSKYGTLLMLSNSVSGSGLEYKRDYLGNKINLISCFFMVSNNIFLTFLLNELVNDKNNAVLI